ncbi:K efflux antiporter 2, chloroplastic [Trifolium repens]|nr:K efflux antiporter 2, chloroplastic [Trifolium repens]
MEIFGINLPQFADRNKQEFNDLTSHDNKNVVFSTGLADSIAVRMVQDQFSLPPVLAMLRIEKRNRIKLHSNYGVQDMQSFLNDKTADPDNPGRRAASFIEDNYDAENKQKDSEMINFEVNEPVVVLGFGQMGQVLANLLSNPMASGGDSSDGIGWPYVAFDIDPRVVKAARKQGFPILYGDGSRPVVLQSAGIFSPKAIMIMLTEKKKSIEAFHRLRLAFPAVPIYARARDVKHLLDLKKAGATDATLEKAETSLQLAC